MSKAEQVAVPVAETPTDDTPGSGAPPEKKVPQRGIRKRVLGEGEGDYCIHEIVAQGHKGIPAGALLPIPNVPRFEDTNGAMKWIKNESGDLLTGKQVMIFRACEVLSLQLQTKPTVVIQSKPKITVNDPAAPKG